MPEIVKVKCPENELFRNGSQVVERFREHGFRAYFVGGAVRDLLLNRLPGDIDLVTEALPQDVLRIFPDSELVGVSFGVFHISPDNTAGDSLLCFIWVFCCCWVSQSCLWSYHWAGPDEALIRERSTNCKINNVVSIGTNRCIYCLPAT